MAATFKRVLIGRNVGISVTPLDIAAGVITEDAALSLAGKAREANEVWRNITAEISAMDASLENNVAIKQSFRLELSHVAYEAPIYSNAAPGNPFHKAFLNSPYVKVIITTAAEVRTYWCTIEECTTPIGPGENIVRMTLLPFDTGEPNPTIAAPA